MHGSYGLEKLACWFFPKDGTGMFLIGFVNVFLLHLGFPRRSVSVSLCFEMVPKSMDPI